MSTHYEDSPYIVKEKNPEKAKIWIVNEYTIKAIKEECGLHPTEIRKLAEEIGYHFPKGHNLRVKAVPKYIPLPKRGRPRV